MIVVSPDFYLLNEAGLYEWSPARAAAAWDRAYEAWAEACRMADGAVLLVGLPGSGKSTWLAAQSALPPTSPYSTPLVPEIGRAAVFDATNTTQIGRQPLIEIAAEVSTRVEAVVFKTPLITAMRRNAARTVERRVPSETMLRMARQLSGDEPTISEGFWRVSVA